MPLVMSWSSSRKEVLRLEHDAVADDTGHPRVQDARRDLAKDELSIADNNGMAGVGAALIAHHEVGPLRQHIDQLSLALVSPLCPDHHHAGGLLVEHVGSSAKTTKEPLAGLLRPRAKLSRG